MYNSLNISPKPPMPVQHWLPIPAQVFAIYCPLSFTFASSVFSSIEIFILKLLTLLYVDSLWQRVFSIDTFLVLVLIVVKLVLCMIFS